MVYGFAIAFLFTGYALAQDSGHESGPGSMHQHGVSQQQTGSHHHESGTHGKDFSLTPEQRSKFRELRRKFKLENAQLIGALVAKKIELNALWSDPNSDPKTLMEKDKELGSILFQLREKTVQSKLEARKFLTPEQMAHFGRFWGMTPWRMMGHRGMMDHGRMMGHHGMMGSREQMGSGGMMCCGRMESGPHGEGHGMHGMGHSSEHEHGMTGMGMCK